MRCPKCLGARQVRQSAYDWVKCDVCGGAGCLELPAAEQYVREHPKSTMAKRLLEEALKTRPAGS